MGCCDRTTLLPAVILTSWPDASLSRGDPVSIFFRTRMTIVRGREKRVGHDFHSRFSKSLSNSEQLLEIEMTRAHTHTHTRFTRCNGNISVGGITFIGCCSTAAPGDPTDRPIVAIRDTSDLNRDRGEIAPDLLGEPPRFLPCFLPRS